MHICLLSISTWWQSLPGFDKIFWSIALLFSTLFVLQTIISFISGDGDEAFGDADAATEADEGIGYGFLTIKNFIAFFTIFGWTGVALAASDTNRALTVGIALIAGSTVVLLMIFLMRSMSKLKASGTLQIKNAIGKTATVYLIIPGNRKGLGKVTIDLQGTLRELNALTDDVTDIPTGSFVKIIGVLDQNVLSVSAL